MCAQQGNETAGDNEANQAHENSGTKMAALMLAEKLFILTIDDERGDMPAPVRANLRYGLAGALLAELTLCNKFQLEEGRLVLIDPTPMHDKMLDEVMGKVALEKKTHKVIYWVEAIGSRQIVRQVAERLASRNIINIEKQRYPWLSPSIAYPQVDGSAKYWVKQRLREMILANEETDVEDTILFSLLKACQLLKFVFTSDEQRSATRKVEVIVKDEVFGKSVAKLLEKRRS